jgi:uncharacterized protein YkuJ
MGSVSHQIAIAFLILGSFSMKSYGADWELIWLQNDSVIYVDNDSLQLKKKGWFKIELPIPKAEQCAPQVEKALSIIQVEARCGDHSINYRQVRAFDKDGNIIGSCSYSKAKPMYKEYAPETTDEYYFAAICRPDRHKKNIRDAKRERKFKAELEFIDHVPCPLTGVLGTPKPLCDGFEIEYQLPTCVSGFGHKNMTWIAREKAQELRQRNEKACKDIQQIGQR